MEDNQSVSPVFGGESAEPPQALLAQELLGSRRVVLEEELE
jgi:hypothetical protein